MKTQLAIARAPERSCVATPKVLHPARLHVSQAKLKPAADTIRLWNAAASGREEGGPRGWAGRQHSKLGLLKVILDSHPTYSNITVTQ